MILWDIILDCALPDIVDPIWNLRIQQAPGLLCMTTVGSSSFNSNQRCKQVGYQSNWGHGGKGDGTGTTSFERGSHAIHNSYNSPPAPRPTIPIITVIISSTSSETSTTETTSSTLSLRSDLITDEIATDLLANLISSLCLPGGLGFGHFAFLGRRLF